MGRRCSTVSTYEVGLNWVRQGKKENEKKLSDAMRKSETTESGRTGAEITGVKGIGS